jgi:hypothetical protein
MSDEVAPGSIDDLMADGPASEPAGADVDGAEPEVATESEAEPEQEQSADTDAPQAAPKAQPAAAAPAQTKLKFKGREFSHEELVQDPRILNALVQTSEQFPALQRKYVELLERLEQGGGRQSVPEAPRGRQEQPADAAPVNPAVLQAGVRAKYLDTARQLASQGFIEKDLVEDYPDFVANILGALERLSQVERGLVGFWQSSQGEREQQIRQSYEREFYSNLDAVAARGGMFEGLKDDNVRGEFIQYLRTIDAPASEAKKQEFLMGQFLAYSRDAILAAQEAAASRAAAESTQRRRMARGEGPARRPSGPPPGGPAEAPTVGSIEDLLSGR